MRTCKHDAQDTPAHTFNISEPLSSSLSVSVRLCALLAATWTALTLLVNGLGLALPACWRVEEIFLLVWRWWCVHTMGCWLLWSCIVLTVVLLV